jgi:hypothetical protein
VRKNLLLLCSLTAITVSVACSQTSPTAPAPATVLSTELGPDGATLKIGAPALVGPAAGSQIQGNPTFSWSAVSGTYTAFPVSYQLEVKNAGGTVVATVNTASTSATVANLSSNADHTWRVRVFNSSSKFGPWSAVRGFKTQPSAYMIGSEVRDPLHTGSTVGQTFGSVTFIPGQGARMDFQNSFIAYKLPVTLNEGEFSFMATSVDEGNPGDKVKVMSMGEGYGQGPDDVTDNDYRFTLEVRGREYVPAGQVRCRYINGDAREEAHRIRDFCKTDTTWNRESWHFYKIWWRNGAAGMEIRRDSPTGPIFIIDQTGTTANVYRPVEHYVYIGAPPARAGLNSQTHATMVVRDVWVSGNQRPSFGDPIPAAAPSLLTKPGK